MFKHFLKFTCAALIFLSGTAWLDATSLTLKAVPKQTTAALSSTLTVTQTSSTTATMRWSNFSGHKTLLTLCSDETRKIS
jgi:hypothetical protein